MTTTRVLQLVRWTTLGLIVLIALGIAFLEFGPEASRQPQVRPVADNAPAGTVVGPGVPIGGPFSLIDDNGRSVTDAAYRGRWMLVFFGYTDCPDDAR